MLLAAAPSAAQPQPSPIAPGGASPSVELVRMRHQIQMMERVLEQAVQQGAQVTGVRIRSLTPTTLMFAGPARARGFRLEGYGFFFDVEVPALRESLTWSFRILNERDLGLERAFEQLRRHVESVRDASARTDLEQALKRLEVQVGPIPPPGGSGGTVSAATEGDPRRRAAPQPSPAIENPGDAYVAEVKNVLKDAMLDYSSGIPIGADEWLAVAARDGEGRIAPGELYDPTTFILRIRGSDLQAFRTGRLTRDETRKRVEVREF